jgi:hypothetical protein
LLAGTLALAAAGRMAPSGRAQDEAEQLLRDAATAMAKLQSFQFEISTVNGTSTILENLELAGVQGAVQRPDQFQADVTAKVAVLEVTVKVIGIGQRLWVTDPLDEQGRFLELTAGGEMAGAQSLSALLNPDRIFLAAIGLVKNAEIAGEEKIDGVQTTVVTGEFDATRLSSLASPIAGEAVDLPTELILERMPITVWIDEQSRVVRLEIEGPLTASESPDVIRAIDFFAFDEPVTIEAPETVTQ